MRPLMCVVVCVCLLFVASSPASATLLGLTPPHYPEAHSISISVAYDADGGGGGYGLLTAGDGIFNGYTELVNTSSTTTIWLWDGFFQLTAVIDSNGVGQSGTLSVTGDLDGMNTVTLFSSTHLLDFGSGADDLFEFLFRQDGDTDLGVLDGDTIGVVLDAREIDFGISTPVFNSDWSGDGQALSDTFYFPEPTTLALLMLGGVSLIRRRRGC